MLNHTAEFSFDQLLLASLAGVAVLFIAYLFRLQIREIRKKHRIAHAGLRFGLIQEITAAKRPLAAASQDTFIAASLGSAIVLSRDTGSHLGTLPAKTVAVSYRWN
ncbi:MAG TPA: hypothetical protein VFD66_08365 [Verrucomicrobiae bacterium]|nr:hypothetical protein [Verrucomicrobiae bacterium]